jgi:ubiquinone/menaquinone biosynthesis C-methylase UbiE
MQQDIKNYWNENPVGTNFIEKDFVQKEVGKQFFLEYDQFRYTIEPHIPGELSKTDWQGKKTLEIGLGQGADSMLLINRGAKFNGIDLTEESIYRLKERFKIFNLPYESLGVADARKISFPDNTFDIVYTHGVIHHSPYMDEIINEIHRVLKPGGKFVLMVYHKNSVNYWLNIFVIRRIGLFLITAFRPLVKLGSKLTGDSEERLHRHIQNFKQQGLSYLSMKNFVHKNTDGPDNVWSTVWSKKSIKPLLSRFSSVDKFRVHYLNERHLMGLQKILPKGFKKKLGEKFGWHLWVYATK